jgi:hypothetical protein
MRFVLAMVLGVGVLSGCAAPATAPGARADGTFTVTRQGETYYAQLAQLTAMATQDAEAHCLKIGRKFKAIHSKETPTSPGRTPQSEVLYRCD